MTFFALLTIMVKKNKCMFFPFISNAFALLRETLNFVKFQSDVRAHRCTCFYCYILNSDFDKILHFSQ